MTNYISNNLDDIAENKIFLRKILDLAVKGLMVVNCQGIIIYINKSFETMHHVTYEEAVGKHVTDVIENTRLHIVAQTGVAERDEVQIIHGHEYVVSRMPITEGDKCLGAIGTIRFEYTNELKRLNNKVEQLKDELKKSNNKINKNPYTNFTFDDIIAIDETSIKIKEIALRATSSDSTVLLLGESGVGKEVYAQSIHNLSKRNKGPFIRMNCSAIQETLFESELFGYEEGAFTGAKKGGKKGKFELANNGTIFLDEIGDMPLNVQSRLLRVLQEREIDKLGSEQIIKIDVRLIAATNKNLSELVKKGSFRKDLFYRLNVIPINIPPLRERKEDIPELIKLFWKKLQVKLGVYHKTLSFGALNVLEDYNWPGNVRELLNILERIMAVVPANEITADHILTIIKGQDSAEPVIHANIPNNLPSLMQSTEKRAISEALVITNNNRLKAAKILGISRALLYKKMHYYNMID